MSALAPIPAEVLAAAPRVWIRIQPGMRIRTIDPYWLLMTRKKLESNVAAAEPAEAPVLPPQPLGPAFLRSPAQRIIVSVCARHEVLLRDLLSPCRTVELVDARFHAAYELRRQGFAMAMIGRLLKRDHSSIVHGVKRWPQRARQLGMDCLLMKEGEAT